MARYLAIDFDATGLFVVSGNAGGGTVAIEAALSSTDDVPQLGAATADALGLRLKTMLQEAKISAAPVLLCVGRDRIVVKEVRYPIGPPEQEPALVRFQAQKDLTEAPDDVVMDYVPQPGNPGDSTRKATVVFLRKEIVLAARQMCEAAGLKLQAIVPRPYAAAAGLFHAVASGAVPEPEGATAAIAHLGIWNKGGEFNIVRGDQLLFSRTISGMSLATEAAFVGEVKRSLAAFAAQNTQVKVQAVVLCEGDVPGGGWAGRLQSSLPVPVYPYDPLAEAGPQERVPARLRGRFFGAAGLLAGKAENIAPGANFVSPRAPKATPSKARPRILVAALLLVVALGGGFVFGRMAVGKSTRLANELTVEKSSLDSKIESLKSDNGRLVAADEFASRDLAWIDLFYDLATQFPNIDKTRLQEFDGSLTVATIAPKPLTAGPGAPGAPKPPGTNPLAKPGDKEKKGALRLLLVAEESAMPEKLKDTLHNETAGFGNVRLTMGGLVGAAGAKVQQFTINADLFKRKPEEFTRQIPKYIAPEPVVIYEKGAEPPREPFVGPIDPDAVPDPEEKPMEKGNPMEKGGNPSERKNPFEKNPFERRDPMGKGTPTPPVEPPVIDPDDPDPDYIEPIEPVDMEGGAQ